MKTPLEIVVTNDDGITAPWIALTSARIDFVSVWSNYRRAISCINHILYQGF